MKTIKQLSFGLIILLFFACTKASEEYIVRTPEEILDLIENKFQALEEANQFHGVILIAKEGIPIFEKAYGQSSDGQINTTDQAFDIASMGKMFTGVAMMQLVDAGLIRVEDKIGQYLPNYGNHDAATKVTIHQLLTHTSGIPDIFSFENIQQFENTPIEDWRDYLPYFEQDKLEFKPGKKRAYSNSGYIVLGLILEAVTGMDYCTYLQEKLFDTAEMNVQCGNPTGGFYTTPRAMLAFSKALLGFQLLDQESTALVMEGKSKVEKNVKYGYGFQDDRRSYSREVSHKGGTMDIKGQLLMFIETGYTVLIYANNNAIGYDGFNEARFYLRDILT